MKILQESIILACGLWSSFFLGIIENRSTVNSIRFQIVMFASKLNFLLILSLFVIFLLSFNNQVNAKRYKSNEIVKNKFAINKKV